MFVAPLEYLAYLQELTPDVALVEHGSPSCGRVEKVNVEEQSEDVVGAYRDKKEDVACSRGESCEKAKKYPIG